MSVAFVEHGTLVAAGAAEREGPWVRRLGGGQRLKIATTGVV